MASFIYWQRTIHFDYNDAPKKKQKIKIYFKIKDSFLYFNCEWT
jgi:hypothetical protein